MKPKFICDNCGEELKTQMSEEDMTIYIIPNKLDGFSVMEHLNWIKPTGKMENALNV